MKRLKRKLITCVTAAIATFFAFAFPFGFVFALADESENTANYEVILNEGEEGEAEEIATSQAPRDDEYSESQTEGEGAEETSEELPPTDEDFDEIKDTVLDKIDGIIPETEWSAWFKEKIVPYILEFLAVAAGALSVFVLVLKRFNLRLGDLIDAVRVLRKANEDSEETKAAVQEQKEEQLAWEQRQEEEEKAWQAQQMQIMAEGFAKIAESVTNKLDDAVKTVHKILDVEEIAYRENPVLVSKGTAHKIEEVIHGDEKKNEPHDEA